MTDVTRREFVVGAGIGAAVSPRLMHRKDWTPAYLQLGEAAVAERAAALREIYGACRLCPRQCGVNRLRGQRGVCRGTARAKISSAHAHFGEERPLVGRGGSGTIFFSDCNLRCIFCQNWEINHRGDGSHVGDEALGRVMVGLQQSGCHNINWVTPTHYLPNIVSGLVHAMRLGLRQPIVYNCGGYEPPEIIQMLDGIVDIYLPDFKYQDGAMAARYSAGAKDYPEIAAAAIAEMHRQVGELVVDEHGVALRGLMIRHLVLPENVAGTDRFVEWVARKLTPSTYVNIMAQYRPAYQADKYPPLHRRLTSQEYRQAIDWARKAGLTMLDRG
jgi:putative pyruvate formate lyase activating enzyme